MQMAPNDFAYFYSILEIIYTICFHLYVVCSYVAFVMSRTYVLWPMAKYGETLTSP